jgi:hypothetical protein
MTPTRERWRCSLEVLTYVSRNLTGARLLIIGTYRDVEVDRNHPLSAALAELRRVSSYSRVLLRGLNADEVRRMLESITRGSVPWGLAEAVHRQTEGNPLFVQEVVRYLNEEGLIKRQSGQWKAESGTQLAMSIPEGLRDVIGKRLTMLSKECNQLLSVASVIGREFSIDILRVVGSDNEEAFVDALKEALRLSILEERSQPGIIRYRFTHAFFRQTLYEEMIAPQRLKLHQQVARALETQYARQLEEHAAELAEHFSQSTDPSDLKKAVEYSEMAAKRASDVYAYGEAARLLDQAIKVQKVLDPDDKEKLCDLLLDLCEDLLNVPDTRRILETEAPAAFSLAEKLSDGTRAARACIWVLFATIYEKGPPGWFSPQFAEWAAHADRYAGTNTAERAWANILLARTKSQQGDMRESRRLLTQALNLARHLDEKNATEVAASMLLVDLQAPQHSEEMKGLAEEVQASPLAGLKVTRISATSMWGVIAASFNVFLIFGQRHKAEEIFKNLRTSAQRSENINLVMQSATAEAVLATLDGRLEDAVSIAESIRARGEEAGIAGAARVYEALAGKRALVYLGTSLEALERELRSELHEGVVQSEIQFCLVLALLGKKEEASEILEKYVVRRQAIGTTEDETPHTMITRSLKPRY